MGGESGTEVEHHSESGERRVGEHGRGSSGEFGLDMVQEWG